MTLTFSLRCHNITSTTFFFLLHNFRHRRFILTIDLSTSAYDYFSPLLIKSTAFTFHLKKALYSFSLAYPNCRHHYSCTSGPFFFLTLQYCIGFAIYQHESATGIHVFPILYPPPSSLPVPSLWVVQILKSTLWNRASDLTAI